MPETIDPRSAEAAAVVARELSRVHPNQRESVLRFLLYHVAAGLVVILGDRGAWQILSDCADAVMQRANRQPETED
jgi:hypothetical protein